VAASQIANERVPDAFAPGLRSQSSEQPNELAVLAALLAALTRLLRLLPRVLLPWLLATLLSALAFAKFDPQREVTVARVVGLASTAGIPRSSLRSIIFSSSSAPRSRYGSTALPQAVKSDDDARNRLHSPSLIRSAKSQ
jgi:hypothetical protein